MAESDTTNLRVPTWLFRALIPTLIVALFMLLGWFAKQLYLDLHARIESKVELKLYERDKAYIDQQLKLLWERSRQQPQR